MSGIKVIFGGAGINPGSPFGDIPTLRTTFDKLEAAGVKTIDTSNIYGASEAILGEAGAASRFTVDTKTAGGFHSQGIGGTRAAILEQAQNSRNKLGGPVDVFFIHAPDANVPLEETLSAINEVYQTGFFKRFGLSNYEAADVEKVYNICKEKGYPLPQVYQGNYSAAARKQESVLFPTLRKLNMSFYAYSPLAGGFLTKTRSDIAQGAGRFNASAFGGIYHNMFSAKASYVDALEQWASIAQEEKTTPASLAYRWVRYNSSLKAELGDALLIGASSVKQLEETLEEIGKGPLSARAVERIDQMWETIKHEAPLDPLHQ
ncbi:Oxidoreductase [Sphaerulina musiva]